MSSSGPSRLRVNGEVVVSVDETDGDLSLTAGTHLFVVEYLQEEGASSVDLQWDGPSFDARSIRRSRLSVPLDALPGAKAAYYTVYDGSVGGPLPNFDTLAPVADGASGRLSTDPAPAASGYALRYRATLRVPTDTTYSFYTTSDGPSRLLVDGQTVVAEHTGEGDGTIALESGTHPLVVEYARGSGEENLTVEWSGPFERTEIPFTALSLNRVEHRYCLTTVDPEGFTSERRCATGAAGVAQPPNDVQASDGQYDDRIFLSWADNVKDAGFRVYRRAIGQPDSVLVETTAPNAVTFADEGAEVGTTYRYCVRALTENGLVSRANCDRGIRARLPTPSFFTATSGLHDDRIELNWSDPSSAEDGYNVYRRPQDRASEAFQLADTTPGATFEYLQGTFSQLPAFDEQDPDSAGVAKTIGTDPAQRDANYALRYRAALQVPESGNYTFYATSDGPSRLLVGEETVVSEHTGTESGEIQLEPGPHPLVVEYARGSGDENLTVEWSGPFERTALQGDSIAPDLGERIAQLPPNRIELTDEAVTPGRRYVYHVVGVANDGGIATAAATAGRRAKVIAPESVTATDSSFENRVQIEWRSKATRASIYRVYRDGERIKTLSHPRKTYTDDTPVADSRHRYCVEAVTDKGIVSEQTCDYGSRHLKAPTELSASAGTEEDVVRLVWSNNSNVDENVYVHRRALGTPSTHGVSYQYVEGSFSALPDFQNEDPKGTGAIAGFNLTPAQRSDNYAIQYRAALAVPETGEYTVYLTSDEIGRLLVDGEEVIGEGGGAQARSATVQLERGPHALTVEYVEATGNQSLTVEWEGPSINRTEIGSEDLITAPGALVAQLPALLSEYTDPTAVPGTTYTYGVYADGGGPGRSDTTLNTGSRVFNAPQDVNATDGAFESKVRVRWSDASQAETGYEVYRKNPTTGDSTRIAQLDKNATSYVDDAQSITVGAEYDYIVEPRDKLGATSPARDRGSTRLQPPRSVRASDGYNNKIVVSWNDVSDSETGYRVLRDGTPLDTVNANETSYTDAGASSGIEYEYCVQTLNGSVSTESRCASGNIKQQITQQEMDKSNFASSILTSSVEGNSAFAADLNRDGAQDVLVTSLGDRRVRWYENDGNGNFVDKSVVGMNPRNSSAVHAADLDGDEDLDVISGAASSPSIGWFENDGEGGFSSRKGISSNVGVGAAANGLHAADLDGDGDQDILAALGQDDKIVWYQNDGGGSFSAQKVITNNVDLAISVHTADLNSDGDQDVLSVSANDGKIAWYENDGSGGFSSQNVIFNSDFGRSVYSTDVDGDGDPDVISGTKGEVTWFENDGGGGFSSKKVIDNDVEALTVRAGDVDGDGDRDVVSANGVFGDGKILWYKNNGGGDFSERKYINNSNEDVRLAHVANIDKDNDKDVIAPFGLDNKIVTYRLFSPTDVQATDGTNEDAVEVTWSERAGGEEEFRIYRDGKQIGTVGADQTSYSDGDARAGSVSNYCVAAYDGEQESRRVCDYGHRPPNGALTGRVTTQTGTGVSDVDVCVAPSPGRGLQLDGEGGKARTASSISLNDGDFTISFWAKRAATGQDTYALSQGETTANRGLHIGFRSGDQFTFSFWDNDLNTSETYTSLEWHHWAVTYDRSTGDRVIYRDGEPLASDQASSPYEGTGRIDIGDLVDGAGHFQGHLDEIRVWDRVRSDSAITADMSVSLSGTEEELTAYWPVEKGTADALVDPGDENGERYAVFEGGAHRGEAVAPLEICAQTGSEGNYELGGIRYGKEATFEVTPSRGNRTFKPSFKEISLSPESPVENEVGFNDISSFGINGRVQIAGTQCPVKDLQMSVDGRTKTKTDAEGDYSLAAQAGTRTISPEPTGDRTFRTAERTFFVQDDTAGVNFVDESRRIVRGKIGGGSCGIPIGTVTLSFEAENGCYSEEVTIDTKEAGGNYEVSDLPPLVYNVRVDEVSDTPSGISQADVLKYFQNNFGTQKLDLTEADDTLDVVYRAPLTAQLRKLPKPNSSCSSGLQVEDETVANVPVLSQGPTPIPYEVFVAEDYGNQLCRVDSATVRVYDEWAGQADEAQELTVRDGVATDTTMAKLPSFTSRVVNDKNRTYQKKISAVAEVGGKTATATEWGLITGQRMREGTDFVTGSTGPIPVKVLRDPPGDASSAFLEEGSSVCRTLSTTFRISNSIGTTIEAGVGYDAEVGFIGFYADQEIETRVGASFRLTTEAINENTFQLCMTTQEGFATSDDELFAGDRGDVFIGTGMNLLFSEMDVLQQKKGKSCSLDRFTKVGYQNTGFETAYTFSRYHIRNSLLPRLSDLMDDARRRIRSGDQDAEDRLVQLRSDSMAWEQQLQYNDSLKAEAETKENRSFDAGAEYTFSRTSEETQAFAFETSITTEIEAWLSTVVDIAGTGFNLEVSSSTEIEVGTGTEVENTDTRTVGYTLSDDDIGDYFSVDVKDDPVFNTPVFELRGGKSSCPWEGPTTRLDGSEVAGTVPRYESVIQTNGSPEKTGVPPDEQATFNVTLTNSSPSSDAWRYQIRPIQSSNPDGAKLRINGGAFNGPVDYYLEPGEDGSTKITLGVERGPYGYRYEDLQVRMYPPCEQEVWEEGGTLQAADTLSLSVQYDAPCTDVELFRPQENWSVNRTTSSLKSILTNFSLTKPKPLGEVGLQYRRSDQEGWTNAFRAPADTVAARGTALLDDTTRYEYVNRWDAVTNIPDGNYQLRAYSQCPTAEKRVYSAPVKGVKDTERPKVLDKPAPADEVLAFGDDISVTFTEPVDCESVISKGANPTALLYTAGGTDTLATKVRCNGERLVFKPGPTANLANYEDSTLTAEIQGAYTTSDGTVRDGITDPVGNRLKTADPLSDSKTWSFEVRRRGFAWKDASTSATVDFEKGGSFTDVLANGSAQDVVFSLESADYGADWPTHPWLSPSSTEGTVPGGETQEIDFMVSDTLGKGTYRDTVLANSAVGGRDLGVTAQVTCQAPFGSPPEGAAYTMNVTARLEVPSDLGGSGVSTDSLDRVAAFVGNELRGVAPLEAVEISNQTVYRSFLTVRSDRKLGETVTFRLWDSSQCRSFFAEQTLPFRSNDAVGTPGSPTTLTATDDAAQSVPLASGWTWISVNTESADSNAVNTALSTVVPSDGDVVKGQNGFSQYSADEQSWVGSLDRIEPGRGYLVWTEEPSSLLLLGDSVAVDQELGLSTGWNWLGFLPQRSYPIDHALQNLDPAPSEGDIIKSQTAFAQYVNEDVGWLGSLETLRPGRGYFLQLSEASTLAYPAEAPTETQVTVQALTADAVSTSTETSSAGSATSTAAGARLPRKTPAAPAPDRAPDAAPKAPSLDGAPSPEGSADPESPTERTTPEPPTETSSAMPEWSVETQRFDKVMTVTAQVQVDGTPLATPEARLGAFVDGELRGVGRPVGLPHNDAARVFLSVHGASQEEGEVSFRVFNPETGEVHRRVRLLGGLPGVNASTPRNELPETIGFVPDRPRGSVGDPVQVNAGDLPDDFTPAKYQLKKNYPNPVTRRTTVRFAVPDKERVAIEIYDLLGRRVRTTLDEARKAGWHEVTLDTRRMASGVYFYRMKAGSFRESHKMVVVK